MPNKVGQVQKINEGYSFVVTKDNNRPVATFAFKTLDDAHAALAHLGEGDLLQALRHLDPVVHERV